MQSAHLLGGALVVLGALLGLAACGGDDTGATFDRDKFAGMYMAEIMYDCMQSIDCKSVQGGTIAEDNPVGTCVVETGELLNADEQRQEKFTANYGRCAAFVRCDYVNCANAEGLSYGDTKRPEINAMCAAQVECNAVNGVAGQTLEICIETKVNELNSFIPMRRDMWDSAFAACQGMAGCSFVNCFDAAFLGATGP